MYSYTSAISLEDDAFIPITNTDFDELYQRFGKHYEYLVGLMYVPKGTGNGIFCDSEQEWIFFNKYKPFIPLRLSRMKIVTPHAVITQTGISKGNLKEYRLASIVFPVEEV